MFALHSSSELCPSQKELVESSKAVLSNIDRMLIAIANEVTEQNEKKSISKTLISPEIIQAFAKLNLKMKKNEALKK